MQAMLGSISGLTLNWTMVPLGPGGSLALHAEYQAFLEASTEDKDSNPDLMIRVDVQGSSEAPPRKRVFAQGHPRKGRRCIRRRLRGGAGGGVAISPAACAGGGATARIR